LAKTSSSRRPLVVRTDKGKEFLNAKFRKLLDGQGVEMRVCRIPDEKCAIVERFNRTLKSKLYKWFKRTNSYRYVDVLDKFITGYNNTMHSSTGMAPSLVSDKDVLHKWERMRKRQAKIRKAKAPPIYSVGQTVRISKEKMRFARGFEQNLTLQAFRIKVLRRSPRPVYELEDLRGESVDGQFYAEELTPVKITKRTVYLVDKILDSPSTAGSPLPTSDESDGGSDDDVLPHFTKRRVTRPVSGQHTLEVQSPPAKTRGTVAGCVGGWLMPVGLSETRIWDGPTARLRVLRSDRSAVCGQHARALSPNRPLPVRRRTSHLRQSVLRAREEDRLSNRCHRGADQIRRQFPFQTA
jgi:hypothetical protein